MQNNFVATKYFLDKNGHMIIYILYSTNQKKLNREREREQIQNGYKNGNGTGTEQIQNGKGTDAV